MSKLYLTFNFILDNWQSPGLGSLWAVVQPHVVEGGAAGAEYPELRAWVAGSETSAGSTFEAWCAGACPSDRVTPVPFPADARVAVVLAPEEGEGDPIAVANDLAQGVRLTDPALFTAANAEPRPVDAGEPDKLEGPQPSPLAALAFPLAYNRQLIEMAAHPETDPARLAASLQLAFWGGSARVLPKAAVDLASVGPNLLRNGENDVLLRTNLHALLGLTFRLAGNGAEALERLGACKTISLVVNGVATEKRDVADFLATLPAVDAAAEQATVSLVAADLQRRVYVREAFRHLEPVAGLETGRFFRLPEQDRDPAGCALEEPGAREERWERPTRLLVRARNKDASTPKQAWRAWRSLDGTLRRYRGTPIDELAILEFLPDEGADEVFAAMSSEQAAEAFLAEGKMLVDGALRPIGMGPQHVDGALTFVGAYDLPWDAYRDLTQTAVVPVANRRTILFVGKQPTSERVTLLVSRSGDLELRFTEPSTAACVGNAACEANESEARQLELLGRRWELEAAEIPAVEFDTLECLVPLPAELKPSLGYPSLLDFSFAQAVGALEVAVTASHSGIAGEMRSAPEAYREELVNFNALNVYADGDHQNPFSQVLPVRRAPPGAQPRHDFVYRVTHPARPERYDIADALKALLPPRYARQAPTAAAFFADLYGRMGTERDLELRLEHTLGHEIAGSTSGSLTAATFGDFRVALPTDVALRRDAANPTVEKLLPFLSVAYRREGGDEVLALRFEVSWLAERHAADKLMKDVHVEAWRSVAELANAASITLQPRHCTFDFDHARTKAAKRGKGVLGDGLHWDEGEPWDFTAAVGERCRSWLSGQDLAEAELLLRRTAPQVPADALFIEWELLVKRTAERSPPAGGQWDVHWRPIPPWRIGAEPKATEPTVTPAFELLLADLRERCAVVAARRSGQEEEERVSRAAALLGTKAKASNGWFALGTCSDGDGEVTATLCPVAFAPVDRDPQLGDRAFDVVNRYLELVAQALLEPQWKADGQFDRASLGAKPKGLERLAEHVAKLVDAALAKLTATPPKGDAARTAAAPDATGDALHPVVREAVKGWLWRDLRNYAANKAFLVTLLQGGSAAAPTRLPPQLLRLLTRRQVTAARTDAQTTSIFEAQEGGQDGSHLRFVTPLDDARYDSSFTLAAADGLTWKALEDEMPATAAHCAAVRQPARLLPRGESEVVDLPSRRSLVPPTSVFCGYIEELQRNPPTADRVGRRLLDGAWQPAADGELRQIGKPTPISRRQRPDEAVFSMLYWVTGDEEETEGFANDRFRLFEVAAPEGVPDDPDAGKGKTGNPFWELLRTDASLLTEADRRSLLERAFAPANFDTVAAALGNNKAGAEVGAAAALELQLQEHPNGKVTVTGLAPRFEVAIFEAVPPVGAKPEGPRRILMMINVLVSAWRPLAYRLLQTRNQDRFDATFFDAAFAGGQPFAYQRTAVRDDADAAVITLPQGRRLTLEQLLTRTVGARHFGGSPAPLWTDFDLSVTVRHHQLVSWMVAGQAQLQRQEVAGRSSSRQASFPLLNHRHRRGQAANALIDWFETPYRDFLVDFQWSSPTNLQFLRIDNVRVVIP